MTSTELGITRFNKANPHIKARWGNPEVKGSQEQVKGSGTPPITTVRRPTKKTGGGGTYL